MPNHQTIDVEGKNMSQEAFFGPRGGGGTFGGCAWGLNISVIHGCRVGAEVRRPNKNFESMQLRCILSFHGFLLLLAGSSFQLPDLCGVGNGLKIYMWGCQTGTTLPLLLYGRLEPTMMKVTVTVALGFNRGCYKGSAKVTMRDLQGLL